MSTENSIPHGFKLSYSFGTPEKVISYFCWSPNGKMLASASEDGIRLWNAQTGQIVQIIKEFAGHSIHTMVWSPDGTMLAAAGGRGKKSTITCSLGHANPGGSAFCDECGEPFSTSEDYKYSSQYGQYTLIIASIKTGKALCMIGIDPEFHTYIYGLEWSPDGTMLAVSDSSKVYLWPVQKDVLLSNDSGPYKVMWQPTSPQVLKIHCPNCGASNPVGEAFCLMCNNKLPTSKFNDQPLLTLEIANPHAMAQSHDGKWLAIEGVVAYPPCPACGSLLNPLGEAFCANCGVFLAPSSVNNLLLLDTTTWQAKNEFVGHTGRINDIVWAPDQTFLVSGSDDNTIRIWRPNGQKQVLEGYITKVTSLSLSSDGLLLASRSTDGSICIWDTRQWEMRALLEEPPSDQHASVAFHPQVPLLATLSEGNTCINIWEVNTAELVTTPPVVASSHYVNAKVVLVGDSGVGKSGLSLVLTGQLYEPTESTHGRKVLTFDQQNLKQDIGQKEQRELFLWDLAGQPGYRVIHQLHLAEVSLALVVFDARNETDPFAGVDHWVRALRLVRLAQEREPETQAMKMFLVAARVDREGKNVSFKRLEKKVKELGFDGYFETSAKSGKGIAELAEAIKQAIEWEKLLKVTSSHLFQQIKEFLVAEKGAYRLLATRDDLYREFLKKNDAANRMKDITIQFELCVKQVEKKGLVRQLSFWKYVLLQPELLDAYASSLVNAVKDEPDGLGSIAEARVLKGDFFISEDERIEDREQEKLLLIAMVNDLIDYEIALREDGEDGQYLVFPSQSMRENPDLPDPEGKAVILRFEGPIVNIYTRLVVRLSHSGLFVKDELWKNAVTFTTKIGGSYGLCLRNINEGCGELVLFFDKIAGKETRSHFEEYVKVYLERNAIPGTIQRKMIVTCSNSDCRMPLDEYLVAKRQQLGFDSMICGLCETRVFFQAEKAKESSSALISSMDRMADVQRDRSAIASNLQGKRGIGEFDVFLCHDNQDKSQVKEIGEKLKERGILPWLDEWELRPGLPWQRLLQQEIEKIKAAAVFVGKDGIGPWQQQELEAFLLKFVRQGLPVIPVLLPGAPAEPKLPIFLENMTWVDFRRKEPDPMGQLLWGITGERDLS